MLALTNTAQYRQFTAATQAQLVTKIANFLYEAGWTLVSAITGGVRVQAVSPQGFVVHCDITDGGAPGFGLHPVYLQFKSSISAAVGFQHTLNWNAAYTYQIVNNVCSFFLSRPGVYGAPEGTSVCGGIPFVDAGCGFGPQAPTEVWYSFGDSYGHISQFSTNPRFNLGVAGSIGQAAAPLSVAMCGCYNGVVTSGVGFGEAGTPRVIFQKGATDTGTDQSILLDGSPDEYPAFVAWGDVVGVGPLNIRGQIYDAFNRGKIYDMDTTDTFTGLPIMNYTHHFYYGSLWLITGQNISYVPAPYMYVNVDS